MVTQVLNDLNGKFYTPLPEKELFRCAKTKKHYKMTNEKIRSLLNLDTDDAEFFTGKRRSKGQKEKSEMQLRAIVTLVKEGFSIAQIADKLNLSVSLVKRRRAQLVREGAFEIHSEEKASPAA